MVTRQCCCCGSQLTVIRVKTNIAPTRNLWESTAAMASSSSCSYSSCDSGSGSVDDTSEEKTNVRLQKCKSEESIDHETCKRVEDDDQQWRKFHKSRGKILSVEPNVKLSEFLPSRLRATLQTRPFIHCLYFICERKLYARKNYYFHSP